MADNAHLVRFGETGSSQVYDFTAWNVVLAEYQDNFARLRPITTLIPGMIGALNQYGDDSPPAGNGELQQQLTLVSPIRAGMAALRDAIKEMESWGRQRLFLQESDSALEERWCYATCVNVDMRRQDDKHTDLFQPVTVHFQVNYPRWVNGGTEGDAFWGTAEWGVAEWDGTTGDAVSGLSTNITITNSGNTVVQPRIQLVTGAAQTFENLIVQRIVNGLVVDQVSYIGIVPANSLFEINARGQQITLNGVDAYTTNFSFEKPDMFTLLPGDNTIKVVFANAGDAATIKFLYYEEYR